MLIKFKSGSIDVNGDEVIVVVVVIPKRLGGLVTFEHGVKTRDLLAEGESNGSTGHCKQH